MSLGLEVQCQGTTLQGASASNDRADLDVSHGTMRLRRGWHAKLLPQHLLHQQRACQQGAGPGSSVHISSISTEQLPPLLSPLKAAALVCSLTIPAHPRHAGSVTCAFRCHQGCVPHHRVAHKVVFLFFVRIRPVGFEPMTINSLPARFCACPGSGVPAGQCPGMATAEGPPIPPAGTLAPGTGSRSRSHCGPPARGCAGLSSSA